MGYAEVCVNSPGAQRQTFSYAIPSGLNINVGQAVWVPFGERLLQGIVLALSDYPAVPETKEIAGLIEPQPLLSPAQVSLSYWLSQHYLAPLFDAVALMLPPGFERKALTFISLHPLPVDFDLSSLTEDQVHALAMVKEEGRISQKKLEKDLGKKKARYIISQLVGWGLVERSYELEPIKIKPKVESYLKLVIGTEQARQEIANLEKKRAWKQATLLSFLTEQVEAVSVREAKQKTNCDKAIVDTLLKKGFISLQQLKVRRDSLATRAVNLSFPLTLTSDQETAFQDISQSLRQEQKEKPKIYLLHGVTGSGKTEVYLQALAEAVRLGKRGIVLVPEIALTPQTIERFISRFAGRVAVLHSELSLGARLDEWQRIRNGEVDVVIGPRSAIFAPQPDLGIIILDEEHEWSYKQSDISPCYHARDVAIKLAEMTGVTVVLGSATPDVGTFYHAQKGDYHLLRIPERVTPRQNSPLPPVEVVDLREELKAGNRSMFSRSLSQAIAEAVADREQVMLFLNRRGGATFIQCRDCGFVLACRRCDIPLGYHPDENILVCHQCNYRMPVPRMCPRCQSRRIKFLGAGTQTVEQEARKAFPRARLLRWDSDATKMPQSHQKILNSFRDHQADILIGTQMIAKGLDLPRVTLVGVVNADTGLNLPDFRAGERTFQLLSQVAGRAGRGPSSGQVIIQTYSPGHYAIQAAARHDYPLFYDREITYRRQLRNPPFSRLASLIYAHTNDAACQREAERMRKLLVKERDARGIADINLIGPAPAFIHRLRGRFRWQLILRGTEPAAFLAPIPIPRGWTVAIDPIGL